MDVTKRIDSLLKQRGWSVYRLGKESGLSQSTLAHIFREDSAPTISTLETICKAFGITLSQFFAKGDFVSLTAEQQNMLDKWATLNEDQKRLVLDMIENMK
jgi:transcriptional regulator with XRE-family HTH domain